MCANVALLCMAGSVRSERMCPFLQGYVARGFNLLCHPPGCVAVLVEHIRERGKLVVSGGVTRGRVARGVIGLTTPKDMASQAQPQKQPKAGPRKGGRKREGGLSPFWRTN